MNFRWAVFFTVSITCPASQACSAKADFSNSPRSAALQIRRICKGFRIHTAFRSSTTLRGLLTRAKDALPELKRSGVVYEVPCICGDVYVGETKRSLETRLKQHRRAAERGEKSALVEHAWEAGHVIEWESARVIETVKNTAHRKFMEALHIKRRPTQCMINRDAGGGVQLSEQWLATLSVNRL